MSHGGGTLLLQAQNSTKPPGVVSRGGFPGRITMHCSYMRSCRLVHLLYLYNDETCRLVVQISSNLTIYRHPASLVLYWQMKHCSNQLADGFEIQLIFPLINIRAKIAVLFIGKINIFLSNAETNKKTAANGQRLRRLNSVCQDLRLKIIPRAMERVAAAMT